MSYQRIFVLISAALLNASVGSAGTAHADSIVDNAVGTYTFSWGAAQPSAKWGLTPCADGEPHCVTVSEYGLSDTQLKRPKLIGNAYWTVGSFVMMTLVKNAISCKETGEKADAEATWQWDAGTNEGTRSIVDPGLCDPARKGKDLTAKFVLAKVGPDAPVPAAAAPAPAPAPAPAAAESPVAPPAPPAAESSAPPPAG